MVINMTEIDVLRETARNMMNELLSNYFVSGICYSLTGEFKEVS